MIQIDLQRLREALPNRAITTLKRWKNDSGTGLYINCFVPEPSLSDKDWDMVMNWQEEIIGKENVSEFYAEETGRHWLIYLKRVPMEFINTTDEDVKVFMSQVLNQ